MRKCRGKSRLGIVARTPGQWRALVPPREEVSKGQEQAGPGRKKRPPRLGTGPALAEPSGHSALLVFSHFILLQPYEVGTTYFFHIRKGQRSSTQKWKISLKSHS